LARGLAIAFAVTGVVVLLCSLVLTIRLARDPVIVLVSLDGVSLSAMMNNSEYTPHLNRIRNGGVTAKSIPSFPTKTWPNHYTLITGLYPEHHGIVANNFYDPESGKNFSSFEEETRKDPSFYLGTPFWKLVNSKQMKSACSQFPTCDVPSGGETPTYLENWDPTYPNYQRIQDVLAWVDLTPDKQPSFIATYMSDVDDVAHLFGPQNVHVIQAMRELDNQLGTLYDGLNERSKRYDIDLIIVSDHGFNKIEGKIELDDFVNISHYIIPELYSGASPQISFWVNQNETDSLMNILSKIPNAVAYRKEDLPQRWHFNDSIRIAPIHLIASTGYLITSKAHYISHANEFVGGQHGWDPDIPSMAGIFIGVGPSFPKTYPSILSIYNVDLFNIMASILGVPSPENDGAFPYPPGILVSRYESLFSPSPRT
jgi:predicted AlkP superfamily pyrophosphatase or phosphodiesterase